MPFFLLGKGPDGQLRLLSDETVPTRHEALTRLSEITAAPEFDGWDSEVFAVDLDQATPVLLVRPAVTTLVDAEPDDGGDAFVEPDEPQAEAADGEEELPAPMTFVVPDDAPNADIAPTVEAVPEETVAEESELAEDEVPAGEVDDSKVTAPDESDEEAPAVDEYEDEEPLSAQDDEDSAEEDELEVSTGSSEPDEATEPDDELAALMADVELDAEIDALEEVAASGSDRESDEVAAAAGESESAGVSEPDAAPIPTPALAAAGSADDAEPSAEGAGTDDADGAATGIAADSEEGDEDSADAAATGLAEPQLVEPSWPWTTLATEGESADEANQDSDAAGGVETTSSLEDESTEEPAQVPAGYSASENDVSGLTCDDCVYTDTCPNKDQREPSSCGSFQWR